MKKSIILIIWLFIISGGIFLWNYNNFISAKVCFQFIDSEWKWIFEVQAWDTFRSALWRIYPEKLFTKIYLKYNPPNFELHVWKYEISCWDISQLIKELKTPINETDIPLTFLEGWNIYDIDEYLSKKWLIKPGEFSSQATEYEWFLYPDTYAINPNTFSIKWVIEKMLTNFSHKTKNIIPKSYSQKEIRDLIILASIVEKEERNPEEKSTVAGILKKRLKEGWMLGADITVCYPYKLTSEQCKLSLTKYLYEKNDYNTRQKTGLPAGPIWNPSIQTIEATLNSKDTPYYYYLHDSQTGKIYYGKTQADHTKNKWLYLRSF